MPDIGRQWHIGTPQRYFPDAKLYGPVIEVDNNNGSGVVINEKNVSLTGTDKKDTVNHSWQIHSGYNFSIDFLGGDDEASITNSEGNNYTLLMGAGNDYAMLGSEYGYGFENNNFFVDGGFDDDTLQIDLGKIDYSPAIENNFTFHGGEGKDKLIINLNSLTTNNYPPDRVIERVEKNINNTYTMVVKNYFGDENHITYDNTLEEIVFNGQKFTLEDFHKAFPPQDPNPFETEPPLPDKKPPIPRDPTPIGEVQ